MIKKAQFYVFAVLILCSLIYMGFVNKISIKSTSKKFNLLYENYVFESIKTVNNAVYENKDISNQMKNFTLSFIEYGKIKKTEIGILYLLVFPNNQVRIVNYLNSPAIVNTIYTLLPNYEKIIPLDVNTTVEINNQLYRFNISPSQNVDLKILMRKEN
jgi:hypothetical protein